MFDLDDAPTLPALLRAAAARFGDHAAYVEGDALVTRLCRDLYRSLH